MSGLIEKIPLLPTTNAFHNKTLQNKGELDLLPVSEKKILKYKWKICIDESFRNCERIHPLQQKKVYYLLQTLKKDSNIKNIMIFGSSVENRCRVDSDVDLYLELFYEKKVKMPLCDFVYDMWTNFTVDTRMLKEIHDKGVIVYERDAA